MQRSGPWILLSLTPWLVAALAARAEEPASQPESTSGKPELTVGLETRTHYRSSDDNRFAVKVPPQVPVPAGTQAFLRTVDPGDHFEISTVTLYLDARWGESLVAHAKLDAIDLYDRTPTSEDRNFDVDEVWIRFGRASEPALLPERPGFYVKVGKAPKFERQNDRHLESYGLVATAFNRFEDTGLELGIDLGRYLYLRATASQGNPLFFRDPNALAGDNGTSFFLRNPLPAEGPPFNSGVPILYDAEVEDVDLDGKLEVGGGLGARWSNADGSRGVDGLVWAYRRTLAKTVKLNGTFYGGDLDLLNGPFDATPVALKGNKKQEVGANLWVYLGGFSFFGQYVDQDIAGLGRKGLEAEAAWRFDLPLVWGLAGRQLFPSIAPSLRYSHLDPDFRPHPLFPAPSIAWDWAKLDYGVRVVIVDGVDLT
ncbi:MAG TPA: hypothetical protein PK413_01935, partial [Thermoanaerobaculia bacterium]|nr:hypothetical protein [Thermoanaerobaculia bacterium]